MPPTTFQHPTYQSLELPPYRMTQAQRLAMTLTCLAALVAVVIIIATDPTLAAVFSLYCF